MNDPATLPPGEALDALVADKVLGLPLVYADDGTPMLGPWREEVWSGSRHRVARLIPEYSTDPGAAWAVVERMAARVEADDTFEWQGPLFKASRTYLTQEGYPLGTTCWYVTVEVDGLRTTVCAQTMPEAVCRAALLCLGR